MNTGTLVIVRHGESTWNASGRWTGTTNVHLSEKGRHEGQLMGEKLKDIHFDFAYVSEQVRTTETLQEMLKTHPQHEIPYEVSGAINERDYGIYTGENKWEMQKSIGEEAFHNIRRGWDVTIPKGESLKMVYERSVPFFTAHILPRIRHGETVLIIAHGNSIRSIVKYIEQIADDKIGDLEMIFGTALIYKLDDTGHMLQKDTRTIDTTLPPA